MTDVLERPALYYPYIHIRSEHWLKATLLCVPVLKRIVPDDYTPEDRPNIAEYIRIVGPRGPLLQSVPASSSAPRQAQKQLLDKLREHGDLIQNKYKRSCAPAPDKYWIHTAKFYEELLHYLLQHDLAWPSSHSKAYGHRTWYALHPVLGSAVMSTLGLSIAREQHYDIVTPSHRFHEALLANREDRVFDALLTRRATSSVPSATQVQQDLSQLVVTLALNLQALHPEDIPELHASQHFRRLQHLIRATAQKIDRSSDPDVYTAQLKHEANEIIEAWSTAQKEIGKKLRDIFVLGAALTVRALKSVHGADFSDLVTAGPLAIGLIRSGRALLENLRHGPYHYLTEIKRAERRFLRMTFPLGLERN